MDKNCLKCGGRGVHLRSNGKIPIRPNPPYGFAPIIDHLPESEPLINCHCNITYKQMEFHKFTSTAPAKFLHLLEKCKKIKQDPIHHPEGNVYVHINVVFGKALKTGDVNLMLAALFHDIGKIKTTETNKHGKIQALGHEKISVGMLVSYEEWIDEMGGEYDRIRWIIEQHMRIKRMDEMRPSKRKMLEGHVFFDSLVEFKKCDSRINFISLCIVKFKKMLKYYE